MVVGIGTEGTLKTLAQLCSCLLSCTDFVDSWISNQWSCAVASIKHYPCLLTHAEKQRLNIALHISRHGFCNVHFIRFNYVVEVECLF